MSIVNCGIEKLDYIIHIADIHIRNWKRHEEYEHVFGQLYEAVRKAPANTIVTVGGDIVHAKTDMSPELISMVSRFFTNLADILPTFIVCGNHDTNLNNNNRLDALTPIIDALRHPNLYYLKDTGVYEVGDCALVVMSVFDEPDKYPKASSIDKEYKRKFALYHGTVENSSTDTGIKLLQGLTMKTFDGYDAALLGDIHKRQILKKDPFVFYVGSLIQQNFGEDYEDHGLAVLDVNTLECKFLDLPNPYGYFTLVVEDGVMPENLPITSKTSVRVKVKNTSPAQIKRVLATLRKDYKNSNVVVNNVLTKSDSKEKDLTFNSGDVRKLSYQNELIKEHLQDLDDTTLEQVYAINKQLNSQIQSSDLVRNVIWKPKRFEFSNMFSYGENNVVDFTSMQGLCGLFAPNHTGKSAILDALCFCLFDHSFRATKAEHVLNNKSDWFYCKFNFELDGKDYFINKKATRYAKGPLAGKLRVDIDFWTLDDSGEEVSLNGEQRRDTDKIIQSYVGTFDDFILTALSLQGNNSNFIEKTQSERKELLSNFLDLGVLDQLYELANKEIRSTTLLLEEYQKQDFETRFGDAERQRDDLTELYKQKQEKYADIKAKLDYFNDEALKLTKELKSNKAQDLDIEKLTSQLRTLEADKDALESQLVAANQQLDEAAKHYSDLFKKIETLDKQTLVAGHTRYEDTLLALSKVDKELQHYKVVTKNKLDKLSKLEEHEYDPNCQFCVNNIFVKDAIQTKKELQEDKELIQRLLDSKKDLSVELGELEPISQQYSLYQNFVLDAEKLHRAIQLKESNCKAVKLSIDSCEHKIQSVKANINLYHENEQIIVSNREIEKKIQEVKTQTLSISKLEESASKELQQLHGRVAVAEKVIEDCVKSIHHMQDLSDKQVAYNYYCKAMSRDGIQYSLIAKAIPQIQEYVNALLSQIVEFTLEFETDGKYINVFICYDSSRWPLELSSGMEKFLASLAIRVALIKATNLPKPNFIAIDEGLGVLDSTNLNSMHMLFNHMKELFGFTLVISHIDAVRDMVDHILTIDKKDDFSYIYFA